MAAFIASMLYSYVLILRDVFITTVFAGLVAQLYSIMLGIQMVYDRIRYGSFLAWF